MKPKFIPPLIWMAAGVMLCVFFVRTRDPAAGRLSQIFLLYGSLAVADGGLIAHTLINRRENLSSVNFGFKLMAEVIVMLAVGAFALGEIFFA